MNGTDVVRTLLSLLEQGQGEEARQHISGDFLLEGWTPQLLTKNQFLALLDALIQSMPDLCFHAAAFREDDQLAQSDRVLADIQLTGTQTAPLHLPPYDIPSSPDTPRTFVLPRQQASFTLMGETVVSLLFSPAADIREQIKRQLQPEEQVRLQPGATAPAAWPQPSAQEWSATSSKQAQKQYNKQSNLYDPQGGSFTPSDTGQEHAPQVFPSSGSRHTPTPPDSSVTREE